MTANLALLFAWVRKKEGGLFLLKTFLLWSGPGSFNKVTGRYMPILCELLTKVAYCVENNRGWCMSLQVTVFLILAPLMVYGCGFTDDRPECGTEDERKVEGDTVYECKDQRSGDPMNPFPRRKKLRVWAELDFGCAPPYEPKLGPGNQLGCLDERGDMFITERPQGQETGWIFCLEAHRGQWLAVHTESKDPSADTGYMVKHYFMQCDPDAKYLWPTFPDSEHYGAKSYFQCGGSIEVSADRKTISCDGVVAQ